MRKIVEVIPCQELSAKYRNMAVNNTCKKEAEGIMVLFDGGYVTNDYDKLLDMTEPLFRWIAGYRSKKKSGSLALTSREYAAKYWFRQAMKSTQEALS